MSPITIPIGPQHPALKEPLSIKLEVSGERILDASLRIGYVHRGQYSDVERGDRFRGGHDLVDTLVDEARDLLDIVIVRLAPDHELLAHDRYLCCLLHEPILSPKPAY